MFRLSLFRTVSEAAALSSFSAAARSQTVAPTWETSDCSTLRSRPRTQRSLSSTTSSAPPRAPGGGGKGRKLKDWGWKPRAVPAAVAEEMVKLHRANPDQWSVDTLSSKYGHDKRFVQAVLELAALEPEVRAQVGDQRWNEVLEPLAQAGKEFESIAASRAGPEHLVFGIPAPWEVLPQLESQRKEPRKIFYRPRRGENTETAEARAVQEHFGGKDRIAVWAPTSNDPANHASSDASVSETQSRSVSASLPEWCHQGSDHSMAPKPRVPFIFVDRDTSTAASSTKGPKVTLRVTVRDKDGSLRAAQPEERDSALAKFGYRASERHRLRRQRFRRVVISLDEPPLGTPGQRADHSPAES
jgi:hypothetical protein